MAYLNGTINCETQNAEPEIGTDGFSCEVLGRVLGQVWNRTNQFLQSKPRLLTGYPDLLLTLVRGINTVQWYGYLHVPSLHVLEYKILLCCSIPQAVKDLETKIEIASNLSHAEWASSEIPMQLLISNLSTIILATTWIMITDYLLTVNS